MIPLVRNAYPQTVLGLNAKNSNNRSKQNDKKKKKTYTPGNNRDRNSNSSNTPIGVVPHVSGGDAGIRNLFSGRFDEPDTNLCSKAVGDANLIAKYNVTVSNSFQILEMDIPHSDPPVAIASISNDTNQSFFY